VYAGAEEEVPDNCPEPLGKEVVMTTFVNANLYHNLVNGRSVTGILHLFNKTVINWYYKKQATVETATYGSEFVATQTAVEQILNLRIKLRHLDVPIKGTRSCSETTNPSSTAPPSNTPTSTGATLHCCFIVSTKQ
jgi:hypothetical protein